MMDAMLVLSVNTKTEVWLVTRNPLLDTVLQQFIRPLGNVSFVQRPSLKGNWTSAALVLLDAKCFSDTEILDSLRLCKGEGVCTALVNAEEDTARLILEKHPALRGVFLRSATRANFLDGIKRLLEGGDWLPRMMMEGLIVRYRALAATNDAVSRLSERELQTMRLVAKGLSNEAIAVRLNLSIHTIKSHVHRALTKLNAANRAHAAAMVLGMSDEQLP